jgi:putative transposase
VLKKTFRYRLYPTAAQRDVLDGQLRVCCELYNAALQERRNAWRMAHVSIRFAGQSAQLPAIKVERPDVADVYSQVLQDVLHRVDKAFGAFFSRVRRGERAGFPRFRAARRFDSRLQSETSGVDAVRALRSSRREPWRESHFARRPRP